MSVQPLLTVAEVADILKTSQQHVRDELNRKNLRGTKLAHKEDPTRRKNNGGTWRVSATDLQTYIDANANVTRVRKSA